MISMASPPNKPAAANPAKASEFQAGLHWRGVAIRNVRPRYAPYIIITTTTNLSMPEHCVQVVLPLSGEHGSSDQVEAIHELTDQLADAIEEQEAGEFDGDEFGGGICRLYMYGPDADKLFDAIKEPLLASPLSKGGHAIKRYGPPEDGIREVRVDFAATTSRAAAPKKKAPAKARKKR